MQQGEMDVMLSTPVKHGVETGLAGDRDTVWKRAL
jgi:hypothetical protein